MSNSARRYVPQSLWVLGWFCLVVAALHWHNPYFWKTAHEVYTRAQAAKAAGNLEAASTLMKNVLAQEKDNLGYLLFDAYVKLDLGRLLKAKESFAQALRLAPDHTEALLGMAALSIRQGDCAAALAKLQRVQSPALTTDEQHRVAGLYAQCGDFQMALKMLKSLWKEPPTEVADLEKLLDMAAAAEDWAYIRNLPIETLLSSSDAAVRTHAIDTRAMALRQLGEDTEAYALYLQAPHDGNLLPRAQLALKLGHFTAAVDLWTRPVAQQPERVAWRRSEAYALLRAGQTKAAENRYRGLITDKAADNKDRIQLAWLLNSQARYAEAWKILTPLPRPHTELAVLEIQARTAFWAGDMVAAVPLLRALLIRKEEG
jgi:tetratricopeptide (TPR) repeat protein